MDASGVVVSMTAGKTALFRIKSTPHKNIALAIISAHL